METAAERAPKIYAAISACMSEIGAIGKGKRNTQQNFQYRGIDDVMNALSPAMIKHHLFVTPEVLEHTREERRTNKGGLLIYSICKVRYTFYAEDGSHISVVTIGEGMDSGDKATNKAMSIAFKYACFQVFCIPTEEMKDPDAESHELSGDTQEIGAAPFQEPEWRTPEQLIQIHDYVSAYAGMCEDAEEKDIYQLLFNKYGFDSTEHLTKETAEKVIRQLEYWYQKKMNAKESGE